MRTRVVASALVVLGASLLALNVYGLTTDYAIPSTAKRFRVAGPSAELRTGSMLQAPRESDTAYFRRLAASIRARMAFYWRPRHHPVALSDNYILHLAQYVVPTYRAYEFTQADRALHRGFGVCSQDANIAFDVLKRQGFHPRTVLLPNHTFVTVRTDGREAIVDADFGIVIPHSLVEVQARPALVRPYYAALDPLNTPLRGRSKSAVGDRMVRAFSHRPVAVNTGSATPDTATIEPIAYQGKWVLPGVLLAAGIALLLRPRLTTRARSAKSTFPPTSATPVAPQLRELPRD